MDILFSFPPIFFFLPSWFSNYLKVTEMKRVLWKTYTTANPNSAKRTNDIFCAARHFFFVRSALQAPADLQLAVHSGGWGGGINGAELNRKNKPRCLMKTCTNKRPAILRFELFSKKKKSFAFVSTNDLRSHVGASLIRMFSKEIVNSEKCTRDPHCREDILSINYRVRGFGRSSSLPASDWVTLGQGPSQEQ